MTRQLRGISGRSGQPSASVFEYKAGQLEKPIEAESASIVPGQLVPIQAVGRNPDGTLKFVQQRTLTIATMEGERVLVFPRAWGAKQLRDAAAARGLLGGKVIRAHAAPPETLRVCRCLTRHDPRRLRIRPYRYLSHQARCTDG